MSRRSAEWVGIALILAVFALNVFRAATQAITCDEAITWILYVKGTWGEFIAHYDTNHHVLHSLLARFSVPLFGESELAMRLPSLCGGLLYLVCARVLCRRAFDSPALALGVQGLLSLNPFVLDYLSIARGYGLAIGFVALGLLLLLRFLDRVAAHGLAGTPKGLLAWASVCHSLGGLSNLTVVTVAGAQTLVTLALALRGERAVIRRALGLVWTSCWPGLILLLALGLPLVPMQKHHFWFGATSFWDSAQSLVSRSVAYEEEVAGPGVAIATALALAALCFTWIVAWRARNRPDSTPLTLLGGTLALTASILVVLHLGLRVLYPSERTGLGLVLPFTCGVALALQHLERQGVLRARARLVVRALVVVLLARFAMQIQTDHYRTWIIDAANKRILSLLLQMQDEVGRPLRVAAFAHAERSLRFYPQIRDPNRFAEFTLSPDPGRSYDAVVLFPPWMQVLERTPEQLVVEWPSAGAPPQRLRLRPRWIGTNGVMIATLVR